MKRFLTLLFKGILTVLSIILGHLSQAQVQTRLSSLTVDTGLSQNSVDAIVQDSYGIVWVANQSGINKYNGVRIEKILLYEKKLDEKIIFLYDAVETNEILAVSKLNVYAINKTNSTKIKKHAIGNVKRIVINADGLFNVFTEDALKTYSLDFKNQKILANYRKSEHIEIISPTKLFLGTANGAYLLDLNTNKYEEISRSPVSFSTMSARDSLIYAVVDHSSVFEYNPKIEKKRTIQTLGKSRGINTLLCRKKENDLWIGTNYGIVIIDLQSNKPRSLNDFNGSELRYSKILDIYETTDEVVWIGTWTNGVKLFQEKKQIFEKSNSLKRVNPGNPTIWSIMPIDKNQVLVGVESFGVYVLNTKSDTVIRAIKKSIPITVYSIQRDMRGVIYAGTNIGLFKIMNDSLVRESRFKNTNVIKVIHFEPSKNIWIFGVRNLENSTSEIIIADTDFRILDSDRVSSTSSGLSSLRYVKGSGMNDTILVSGTFGLKKYYLSPEKLLRSAQKIEKDQVLFTYHDKNVGTYLATSQGLKLLKPTGIIIPASKSIPKDVVNGVVKDKSNTIWLSTNNGIYSLKENLKTTNFFSTDDGLQDAEFNAGAVAYYNDGLIERIYFGGVNGLNFFSPRIKRIEDIKTTDPCNFEILGKDDGVSRQFVAQDSTEIETKGRSLQITPIIINYQDIANNEFRFRVQGNNVWIYMNIDNRDIKVNFIQGNNTIPIHDGFTINQKTGIWGPLNESNVTIEYQYRNSYQQWSKTRFLKIKKLQNESYLYLFGLAVFSGLLILIFLTKYISDQRKKSKKYRDLTLLNQLSNEVSRAVKIEELWGLVGEAFIDNNINVLGFDYATISLIDFATNRINTKHVYGKQITEEQINYWKNKSSWSLDDRDILSVVSKGYRPVIVIGANVIPIEKDHSTNLMNSIEQGEAEDALLSTEIFERLNHIQFARVFFPIIFRTANRAISKENSDIPLGIVEAGFVLTKKMTKGRVISRAKRMMSKRAEEFGLLSLIDNAAQSYYKALVIERKTSLISSIESLDRKNNLTRHSDSQPHDSKNIDSVPEYEFLKMTLSIIVQESGSDFGAISLSTLNEPFLNIIEKEIYYNRKTGKWLREKLNVQTEELMTKRDTTKFGLARQAFERNESIYINDVSRLTYYIESQEDIRSEMAVPLISSSDKSKVTGVLVLSSSRLNNYNRYHIDVIESVMEVVTEQYLAKKRLNVNQFFISDYDFTNLITTETNPRFWRGVVSTFQKYFDSDYVGFWKLIERGTSSINTVPNISMDTYNFLPNCSTTLLARLSVKKTVTIRVQEDETPFGTRFTKISEFDNKNTSISNFCKNNRFVAYISIKLHVGYKTIGFVNVFSRKNRNILEPEEIAFCQSVISKIALELQINRAYRAIWNFSEIITDSLQDLTREHNRDNIRNITTAIQDALSAHSVSLFIRNSQEENFIVENAYLSGNINVRKKDGVSTTANLANSIYQQNEKIVFIRSETDFLHFRNLSVKESNKFKTGSKSFWNLNNLKAVICCQLLYKEEILGILLINFKSDISLNSEFQTLLESFINFSSLAITNLKRVKSIGEKIDSLVGIEKELKTTNLVLESKLAKVDEEIRKKEGEMQLLSIEIRRQEESKLSNLAELDRIQKDFEIQANNLAEAEKNISTLLPKVTRISFYQILQGLNHQLKHSLLDISIRLSGILEDSPHLNVEQRRFLQESANDINKRISSFSSLIALFNFEEHTTESFSLQRLVLDIFNYFKLFDHDRNLDFEISSTTNVVPEILANKGEVTMILYNLIYNSIYAISQKRKKIGTVSYRGHIKVSLGSSKSGHKIDVYDNGTGIDSQIKNKIFERGVSTKGDEGTGIGLYFANEILKKEYNGEISFTTSYNNWTLFSVIIPFEHQRNKY